MYCPNCGETIPDSARVCGFCGYNLSARRQKPPRQAAPPVQPIIVQTHSGGGIFSSCMGTLNFALGALVVGLITIMVLVLLCIIHLPADFPLIDPPAPLQNLWQRARDWQAESCDLPREVNPVPVKPEPKEQDEPEEPKEQPEEEPEEPVEENACIQADTQAACEAAGGQWQHIFVDPGPSFDTCICPGVNPFE